jgi:hypothetical protein
MTASGQICLIFHGWLREEATLKLEWTVNIGNILTMLTIIVSVIALIISWSKDQYTRQKEQADRVRSAVARTIAKLDRWQSLQLSAFQELQLIFIETSEMLVKNFDLVTARDYLWKSINAQRTNIAGKILDEQIQTAYVDLFSHFPEIRNLFLDTLSRLNNTEKEVMLSFLKATQQDVLALEKVKDRYTTALLGNALRATAEKHSAEFEASTSKIMEPIREFLFQVVGKRDREILTEGIAPPA